MRALLTGEGGWTNHPVVNMWEGYERALLAYQQAVCNEWTTNRGYVDNCWDKTRLLFLDIVKFPTRQPLIMPPWFGDVDFHIAHQSTLLRKDPEHYRPMFPGIRDDHPMVYPGQ